MASSSCLIKFTVDSTLYKVKCTKLACGGFIEPNYNIRLENPQGYSDELMQGMLQIRFQQSLLLEKMTKKPHCYGVGLKRLFQILRYIIDVECDPITRFYHQNWLDEFTYEGGESPATQIGLIHCFQKCYHARWQDDPLFQTRRVLLMMVYATTRCPCSPLATLPTDLIRSLYKYLFGG